MTLFILFLGAIVGTLFGRFAMGNDVVFAFMMGIVAGVALTMFILSILYTWVKKE